MTYPQEATTDVQTTAGSRGGGARVMVVGTQDGTTVTFTPVGPVTDDPSGDPPDLPAGAVHTVTLDDGDVFQIYSGAKDEDLTGAEVVATCPGGGLLGEHLDHLWIEGHRDQLGRHGARADAAA